MNKKMQAAASSIEIANNWEAKNQPAWVVRCLSSALMNYLSVAVCEMNRADEAQEWLRMNQVEKVLDRYAESFRKVVSSIERGTLPASVLGGAYGHGVMAHLSTLLGAPEAAKLFALIGSNSETAKISPPFWAIYAECLHSLLSGEKKPASLNKRNVQEKFWVSHLSLMNAAMIGGSLEQALRDVEASFAMRNREMPAADDPYEIEGSAQRPALWDFRKEAILIVVRSAY